MKIPKEAKKVFGGVIFDVYHWEQKLFDGSTATFEAIKRADTVQVVPIVGDKILLASEEQPHYARKMSFLGGRIEPGEEPLIAAKREFLEETGMTASSWELFKVYPVGGKIDWDIYYYIAKGCQKVSEPHLDPGEWIDVKEVSFDEFVALITSEGFDSIGLVVDILRMRLSPEKLEAFKNKLLQK